MTDNTDTNTIGAAPDFHATAAEPAVEPHAERDHNPDPLPEAEIVQPAETAPVGEALIAADAEQPPAPKVFPMTWTAPNWGAPSSRPARPAPDRPPGR